MWVDTVLIITHENSIITPFFRAHAITLRRIKMSNTYSKKKNKSFYFVNKFYFVFEYVINNKTITLKKTVLRYVTRQ